MEDVTTVRDLDELAALARAGQTETFRQNLWQHAEDIRRYLLSFRLENAPAELTGQYVGDALARFLRTLEFVPLPPPGRILEIGSNPYFFHLLLRKFFPQATVSGTNFFDHNIFSQAVAPFRQRTVSADFQEDYTFESTLVNVETVAELPYPPTSFDLVFFCETLEHLVVNPLSTFAKILRILRPGGHLIVTLPNAVRLTNVALMLEGLNFFDLYSSNGVNGRHNREYTLAEIVHQLEQNGYRIVRAETYDRFDYDRVDMWSSDYTGRSIKVPRRKAQVLEILRAAGATLADRGDNLYVLARHGSDIPVDLRA